MRKKILRGVRTPVLVALIALLMSGVISVAFYAMAGQRDQTRLNDEADLQTEVIQRRVDSYVATLGALDGLFETVGPAEVTAEQFRTFTSVIEHHTGEADVGAVVWLPRVNHAEKDAFVARMRIWHPDFEISPAGARDVYFPVTYLESRYELGGRKVIGSDMYAVPVRRAVMDKAAHAGEPTSTGRVEILTACDGGERSGFVLFMPVYANSGQELSPERRFDDLAGFVMTSFCASDLAPSMEVSSGSVEFDVYSDALSKGDGLIFSSRGLDNPDVNAPIDAVRTVQLPQAEWTIAYRTTEQFDERSLRSLAPLVFLAGAFLSVALGALTWSETRARARAEAATAQLRESREALQKADTAKNEFLAMLGHELRNPLSPMLQASEILEMQKDVSEAVHMAAAVIKRQVRQLTRLVDDLLDVARITSGRISLQFDVVDVKDALDGALEICKPLIEQRHHNLTVSVQPGLRPVCADPARLVQIIANILNNAAKYTPPGGAINVEVQPRQPGLLIAVRDNGAGISPEFMPHLFELFAQDEVTLARDRGGLGLGLALVKQLVKLHHGEIWAESAGRDQGSTFYVYLPPGERRQHGREAKAEHRVVSKEARRILVVDDNRDAAEMISTLLQDWGHTVALAYDGLEAVVRFKQFKPQVVLLDIGLPGMDGYEVAQTIRSSDGGQDVSLIAVTGYGHGEARERARQAGFDHHLLKPLNSQRLRELIAPSFG